MADKMTFIGKLQDAATRLAQVADDLDDLTTVFFDRGYNVGGANQIVDGDISAGLGITAADVSSMITLAQQLKGFLDNAAVTTGDYDSTLNKMRTDV